MQRLKAWAIRALGPTVSRALGALPLGTRIERFLLRRIWSGVSAEMLDHYLVSGYQNPRINMQSVLLRHFLLRRLGISDPDLMEGELRFAVELNEALQTRAAELGVQMGSYIDPRKQAAVRRVDAVIAGRQSEFEVRWASALAGRPATRLEVLELACGSANDYRSFVDYGIARHLDYRGIDLTPKNIENARRRFPDVAFEVGDMLDLPMPDRSVDYVIASDVFEHLSLAGMEQALSETTRLARRGVAFTFFNMSEAAEHEVHARGAYHWNRLSRPRIDAFVRERFPSVTVFPIAGWLTERFEYRHSYNRHAYSIFAERTEPEP